MFICEKPFSRRQALGLLIHLWVYLRLQYTVILPSAGTDLYPGLRNQIRTLYHWGELRRKGSTKIAKTSSQLHVENAVSSKVKLISLLQAFLSMFV